MQRGIEPQILEQLMSDHGAALQLFAAQWTSSPEDCVQEAFLQLMRLRQPPANVPAWLYRVVRNRAISWRRTRLRRRRRESVVAANHPRWFTSPCWSTAEIEEVTIALRTIDQELREVVIARIWGGLSFDEIATVVATSTSTAHRRYEAGLRKLRERLGVKWEKNTKSTTT